MKLIDVWGSFYLFTLSGNCYAKLQELKIVSLLIPRINHIHVVKVEKNEKHYCPCEQHCGKSTVFGRYRAGLYRKIAKSISPVLLTSCNLLYVCRIRYTV